ncbi:MAG: peptidoglycan bridge formation glycyltransferase FemA/FemB family protein [Candidatus Magasanikbacteria bacterium]
MDIVEFRNKDQWNDWIINNSQHHPFTQSWVWGDILLSEGKKVKRFQLVKDGQVLACGQAVCSNLPMGGQYLFFPKGPILAQNYVDGVIDFLKSFVVKKKIVFLRIEPEFDSIKTQFQLVNTIDINPRATVVLNLTTTESDLLSDMHHKTRYNINLAQKKNLVVNLEKNFGSFFELMEDTGKRDGFRLHNHKHYQVIIDSDISKQITIYWGNKAVAVGVFVGFGDTFTYLYGASDYTARALMAPYLVQWEGIKLGKKLGYKYYDFFGIAPGARDSSGEYQYNYKHQYAGVTRFKLGFGGDVKVTHGTVDVVVENKKYKVYKFLRWLRRLL